MIHELFHYCAYADYKKHVHPRSSDRCTIDVKAGFDECRVFHDNILGETVVAIQGSGFMEDEDSMKRWINNLRAVHGKDKIHNGFQHQANELYRLLEPLSHSWLPRVTFCGISRGGALAAILLAKFKTSKPNFDGRAFGYGSPRFVDDIGVIDPIFHSLDFTLVINGRDVVPHLPIGYEVLGRVVQLPAPAWHHLPWTIVRRHTSYYDVLKTKGGN